MNRQQSQKCVMVMRWKPFVTQQLGSSLIQSPKQLLTEIMIDTQLTDFINRSMILNELLIGGDNARGMKGQRVIQTCFNCRFVYPNFAFLAY